MPDRKEVERLMRIAESHARAALAKPPAQRESHLAFCRLNWKRYAAGQNKSPAACERFADALARATRDLMALLEANGGASLAAAASQATSPGSASAGDAVDAESDAVWAAHDLGYDVAALRAAAEAKADSVVAAEAQEETAREIEAIAAEQPATTGTEPPPPAPPETQIAEEEEDRLTARYSFGKPPVEAAKVVPIRADEDLQRKVQAVMRAHQQAMMKMDEDDER